MGQSVILAEGKNADSYGKMLNLNPPAAMIWSELKDTDFTAVDITNLLMDRYGIDPVQAQADAAHIIDRLAATGCIEQ